MSTPLWNQRSYWRRIAQLLVVLLCALALKQYYSTASPNELRWILAPTTTLVELVSGKTFEFESYSGYLSSDRTFLIAGSCAGVNFLITAFLLLSLRKLWRSGGQNISWRFFPLSALIAYLATLVANTVRISTALLLQQMPLEIGGISPNQLHRFEGIFIYFGFLLLLFMVSEIQSSNRFSDAIALEAGARKSYSDLFRQYLFPLLIYYTTTLAVPVANSAYRHRLDFGLGPDFWQHSLFVLLTPLLLILLLAAFRFIAPRAIISSVPRSTN
ncbi:MAG TPA: exosortase K [Pyrinomonadaceae bacterium]|nr:exosortase K [Pyrinomonadaceae bacterium]